MTTLSQYKTAGIGALLAFLGFLGGYMTAGQPHCTQGQAAPAQMAAVPPPPPGHRGMGRQMMEVHWSSQQPQTTVIVMQDGRPIAIEQTGGPMAAPQPPAPPRDETRYGLLLAVLLLSLMPMATWAALSWNRRRNRPSSFSPFDPYQPEDVDQEFVPRRDD